MMDPFSGTWIANLEKSHRHVNHQFKSAAMRFAVAGDRVSITHSGVNMSGKQETGTTEVQADGQEHDVSPEAPGVVVVTTWVGTHRLQSQARKDGVVVGQGTYEVSPDGAMLTATMSGTDASGNEFDQVIVFDREGGPTP